MIQQAPPGNAPVVVAAITAASAIVVAAVTYFLTRKREREAEWRKLKLERYREFVAAFSGITGNAVTPDGRQRFAYAINDLALVAPPEVLRLAYALMSVVNGPGRTEQGYNAALSALFRALRKDAHPELPDEPDIAFQLFSANGPAPGSAGP